MKQCIHIYTNSDAIFYAYGRSRVMAYFVLNILFGPMLDEDLHHQMAFISGQRKSSISLLPETDTQ
jgi:hypothetical protein